MGDQLLQELDIPLCKAFLSASVRFTHLIQTTDDAHVNLAWAAFCRGAAIIRHPAQDTVDLVILVVFNRDNRMAKEEITAIIIKCKLRARRQTHPLDAGADSIRFFGSGWLPYIAIAMDLGEAQDEVECPARPFWSSKEVPNTLSDVHPRYAIAIRGCSRVYTAIDPGEEALYKKLLGKGMSSEHPRQEKDNLDAVRWLVPLWAKGEASMDWVEGEVDKDPSVEG